MTACNLPATCFRAPSWLALWLALLCGCPAFGQAAKAPSDTTGADQARPDQDHPREREQWFMRGRRVPGQSAAALRYRAHMQKIQARLARMVAASKAGVLSSAAATSGWKPLGPAPLASDATGLGQQDYNWVSGRATAVAVDPADSSGNTVYVGGAYGGVWKSSNAGPLSQSPASVTWTPLTDDQATLAVGAIAIQPQLTNLDPGISVLLVGTGETNSTVDSYYGLGILRSADAGVSWTLISSANNGARPFAGLGFSQIAFNGSNPSLVVAAAAAASQGLIEGLENPATLNRGLYYSTDSGLSWTYASVKDGSTTIDPGSATSVVYNPVAGKFFAVMRFHGIYSSSDGANWSRLASQPGSGLTTPACPANPTSDSCPIYRGQLAVLDDRDNPDRNEMYVWSMSFSPTGDEIDQGIWRTTDSGNSWTQLTSAGISNCGDPFGCGILQGSYNLALAAVPYGQATDLYAGTVNLYKCTLLNPSNTSCSQGSWLNLTHAYGCPPDFGSIAHVHPDQHDLDSIIVDGRAILYFGNDGGIYRALDGYTGLTTGACSGNNHFDSLNQTLGSMTQFVSLSQNPGDANIIMGGAQDNGSPATASSQGSAPWFNVNSGDGGYTEINPSNPNEWFIANTGVSIQKCSLGINCHAQDFNNGLVVSNSTLGGDHGPFYTPYLLDPQNFGELVVGTCRVWRGTTAGTGFTALSNNFDAGSSGACTGNEINQVRALAAGGSLDGNGFSNVIYAGTDGFGPLQSTSPAGGRLWVSTDAAGGVSTWSDRTGPTNPGNFPISGIAIDTSDGTGRTAYIAIMGFHSSHVWKTTSAGAIWTDFSANLPDAPVNAVIVDPGPTPTTGTVYVATDVGVFFSSTASAAWTEVGPASGSGFLPNVAVTALRIFTTSTTKLLRASTYGRGVWQFPLIVTPDFQMAVSSPTLTMFPSQTATFSGILTAVNGYTGQVKLSCLEGTTPPPHTCKPSPTPATPTDSGAAFTLTAADILGDYSFSLHGVGTDAKTTTHDAFLNLQVVDFGLTPPSPNSVTVNRPGTSPAVAFQVTAAGSFSSTVTLSCLDVPFGAACNFSPSSSVNPTSAAPAAVTLSILATSRTFTGTFPVTISASTPGAPSTRTQILTLLVTASPDYTINISNPSLSATVGEHVTFNGTLASINGYSSVVNLSCGAGAPPTCTPSASLTPSDVGVGFTVTVGSDVAKNYNFNIAAQGTDSLAIAHVAAVTFSSTPDSSFNFIIAITPGAQTVVAGQVAAYSLDVTPSKGNFPDHVALSCSALPSLSTCSFSPAQVDSGSAETTVRFTITTTAPLRASVGGAPGYEPRYEPWYGLWLPLPGLVLIFGGLARRSLHWKRLALLLSLTLIALLVGLHVGCGGGTNGGGGQPGTPPGTYKNIMVSATMSSITHSKLVTLTVQ